MTFLSTLMANVDPFAVYAAERELATHGRSVPREVLVPHYLRRGQLRTLVIKLIAAPPGALVDHAVAAAVAEGPDESANPRFVSPLRTGMVLSFWVLVVVAVSVAPRMVLMGMRLPVAAFDTRWVVGFAGFTIAMCMAYAYIGARIGRDTARKLGGLLAALVLVGAIFLLTRYLDRRP
jgi:hypothetical protein